MNDLLEKSKPLTLLEKRKFAYFGEKVKILPPFRILNPQRIFIGDYTSIREGAFIHAYCDNRELLNYVDPIFKSDFEEDDYLYDSKIVFGRENQIGRFLLMSCTNQIETERNVLFSDRVFVGDNNHTFSHPHVPIMQQPNEKGLPIKIGAGSWIGIGAALLPGTQLGHNCVVGANSPVSGTFEPYSVLGTEHAKLLFKRRSYDNPL